MKKLWAIFLCLILIFSMGSQIAFAEGDGNMDAGGGGMGEGTSDNYWNGGEDGVRITVIRVNNNSAASASVDFSNKSYTVAHFGKVSKLDYRDGKELKPSGSPYVSIIPQQPMPRIVSGNGGSYIEAIKKYFCSEYAAKMVADATGISYQNLINGEYKLLIEPIAYFTFNGIKYCMTATEAGLYDQIVNGRLRSKMVSLTHKNLPLSLFLEYPDLGFPAWDGPTTLKVSNAEIISSLGLGIVKYKEEPEISGDIDAPDVEYRVDTDVITNVTLRATANLTPDNPASVTFNIQGHTYTVTNVVIPAGDSQVVWVKWHTPSTPATLTISVSVSGAYTAKDTLKAKIVALNDKIPPDPLATDTKPGYVVPSLPSNTQKTTANWGVWNCYWVPVWVWCSLGTNEDGEEIGYWMDEGYWAFQYTGYSASLSATMSLMPDDIVPTANGKTMKSGYGVKTVVSTVLSTSAPSSHYTYTQTAFSTFPEFNYQTYLRLLERTTGGYNVKFQFQPNNFSTYNRNVHFVPVWFPDGTRFTVYTQVWDTWTPDGMLSVNLSDYVSIQGSLFDDWYTSRE
ncbi:hypothetical protein [Anaerocolumna xylanovorans]|uniref:Uncharacterized protein n=1 Tax=Anaerocolumna xylanovorans DSM 12503 TaxID=1121345 RepID=A0A1M7YNK3_9FIRM|nr:hypothetical protein [Anaerocolumna xylanovorans]SHO54181.1 hypothetical protein SAMN02745217_04636 [Anaerocolumna xylanovorans DSM 12503]